MKIFCVFLSLFVVILNPAFTNQSNEILKEKFADVLLVINFNHPHYDNIEFLEAIYSPVFPNILFYGEVPDSRVIAMAHDHGRFSHNVLKDAMIRCPDFKGYLYIQDDCFVSYWNLVDFDKDKIWFTNIVPASIQNYEINWFHWNTAYGIGAVIHSYNNLPVFHKNIINKNLGENFVAFEAVDFVYVPGRLSQGYVDICDLFINPLVFVELAIPTMLCALDDFSEWSLVQRIWTEWWAGARTGFDLKKNCWVFANIPYNPEYHHWIHPIKFSEKNSRDYVLGIIKKYGVKQ